MLLFLPPFNLLSAIFSLNTPLPRENIRGLKTFLDRYPDFEERGRRRNRDDSSPLKIESFLEIIEQDETPRAAAPVRGAGTRINFEMVYFRRMYGERGVGRLPRKASSSSSSNFFFPGWKFLKGGSRSNWRCHARRWELCVVIRGKRASREMRVREVTCWHRQPPPPPPPSTDLKSVARSPVFTVSPFFLVYRPRAPHMYIYLYIYICRANSSSDNTYAAWSSEKIVEKRSLSS